MERHHKIRTLTIDKAMMTAVFRKLSLLFLCLVVAGCATVYNPATGRNEFILISTDQEVAMGANIHQEIIHEYKLSSNLADVMRLKRIGAVLAKVSDRQDFVYNFYLVENKELNAFTVPGGSIYFFTGLFKELKSDEEIAAVLAHEIGHCSARHTVKKFQAALGYDLLAALVLNKVEMGQEAKQTLSLASDTAMQLAMSAYGRKDEYEADRLGVKYMYLAGYNLDGMIKTLKVLETKSQGSQMPLILRTHPYIEDRIKAAQEEIRLAPEKYSQNNRPAPLQEAR